MMAFTIARNRKQTKAFIPEDIVLIPDDLELVARLIAAIDVPRGTFGIDLYKDYRLSSQRIPELLNNLERAIVQSHDRHRQEVIAELKLPQWEDWAVEALAAVEQKDSLLPLLRQIKDLCAKAFSQQQDILIMGD